jgi:hypothetical protein
MPNSDHRAKVTIEDLLRLKRAERPDAAFWSDFERELRQKQLTALLEKRPWWHNVPQLIARRAYLPIGATAILAFTLISVKYYAPLQVAQMEGASAGAASSPNRVDEIVSPQRAAAPVSSPLVNRNDQIASAASDRAAVLARNDQPTAVDLTPASSLPAESPSARSIAANLAHLEQSEPELINSVLGNRLSSRARVQADPAAAEELAALTATSSSKRSRLLAHYNDRQVSSPEPSATDTMRERIARRLADTDYTERFSRIGLKGDQVSLKF